MRRLFDEHRSGKQDNHKILFSLMVLEEWLRAREPIRSCRGLKGDEGEKHALEYVMITPARNEAAFIEKTIQSVIAQTVLPSDGSS